MSENQNQRYDAALAVAGKSDQFGTQGMSDTPQLQIKLFGKMSAVNALGRSVLPRCRKTRALLAVLAISPQRPILRSRISGLLWSQREKEQACASLRQAVHELRRALGPDGAALLQTDRNHVALQESGVWVDTIAFRRATSSNIDPLTLFTGPLLEDLRGLDPEFDHWLIQQTEHLAQIARTLGETILSDQHDPAGRQKAAEQLLAIDPAHEAAWRVIIGVHLERSNHSAALAAYERCRSALAQVGVSTASQQTEAMVHSLRGGLATSKRHQAPVWPKSEREVYGPIARNIRLGVAPLMQVEQRGDDELALTLMAEITAALVRFRWITCVAHVAGAEVASEGVNRDAMNLDFVLDGTIQRYGSRVRITARLSDMRAGGSVVWARRFDRDLADIFALQDDITAETVAQIDAALLLWEAQRIRGREWGDPTAMDLVLRAIPLMCRLEPKWFLQAGEALEAAVARDPTNAASHGWLAYWHIFLVGQGWAPDAAAAVARATDLAECAVRLDPGDARAITLAGHVCGFLTKRPEEARALHDRAIALNPNLALAWCFSGLVHSYLGHHAEATRRIQHARRLSPHDPQMFFFDTAQIMPHLLMGEYEEAAELGRRATAMSPGFTSALKGRLAALGHLRREAEAADVRARLLALEPGFSVATAAARSPMTRDEDIARYLDGLQQAGLPK